MASNNKSRVDEKILKFYSDSSSTSTSTEGLYAS